MRGLVPATGGEHISDTYKFKHHTITIPQLTAADRILEAVNQLDTAISQQPKQAPMDEQTAIELLREVLLGEKKQPLPPNSLQRRKSAQRAAENEVLQPAPSVPVAAAPAQTADPHWQPLPTPYNDEPNYISDDESMAPTNHRARRIKRILRQQIIDDQQQLHHIVIPDLEINQKRTVSQGLGYANEILQME